jgi:hypothetical protein
VERVWIVINLILRGWNKPVSKEVTFSLIAGDRRSLFLEILTDIYSGYITAIYQQYKVSFTYIILPSDLWYAVDAFRINYENKTNSAYPKHVAVNIL